MSTQSDPKLRHHALPIHAVRTQAGVLWKEACALADQLLLTGFLPDAAQQPVSVGDVQADEPVSIRPDAR